VADCGHWYYVRDMSATAPSDKAAVVSLRDAWGMVWVDATGVGVVINVRKWLRGREGRRCHL